MTQHAVSFQCVTKTFGSVRAVGGLDLTLDRGETVALLGANGAGKSTSISMLLGLLEPTAGQLSVLGGSPNQAVAEGRIGAMLQDGGLMPGVTVGALVSLACRIYPSPRPVKQLLADADLISIASRRTDRLSGGQAQRLRFALAIAGNPQVLVLDEPTAAMDVESRRAFWTTIRGYAAGGRTVLFATHYMEEADENADRIVVIAGGRVVTDGTPTEIKAAAGGRSVRFTLGGESCAGLDLLPGVRVVEVHGGTVALRTTDVEATVRALFATRDQVPDLEVGGADLEDAVLALTR
ncbi:ABC transporter ATP-binding protein [Actinacidiphila oryziradicis]|uniref:ABC transporter ATP-binding protein n=1 Tax=Actinacidiphila oryziradicis TaxID=2571141 RepID=A0A4U0SF22_9ACTN|nr:ABC transporter ATP-binding protein [Actinacidiphila oryziradicis]TKA06341.1 ABC transporter ATP-binding protein [Actinacidiphila oryziradicis]